MTRGAHDCQDFDAVLWRYVDREMSAREMAEASAVLRECEACRLVHDRRVREARVLRAVLADPLEDSRGDSRRGARAPGASGRGDSRPAGHASHAGHGFDRDRATERGVERFLARFETERLGDLYPIEERFELHDFDRSTRQRRWRFATVLSMLVLIPALVGLGLLVNHHQSRQLGALSVEGVAREGDVLVEREEAGESRTSSLEPGSVSGIDRGARYSVPDGARLRLLLGGKAVEGPDGGRAATLIVFGPAELSIHKNATLGSFRASVSYGRLEASVDPSFRRDLFEITSPHAFATVVGTVFRLRVDSEGTELEVTRGRVDFGRLGSSRQVETVTVQSGPRWIAAGNARAEPPALVGEPRREDPEPPVATIDADDPPPVEIPSPLSTSRDGPDLDQPVGEDVKPEPGLRDALESDGQR